MSLVSLLPKVLNYGKRALKLAPEFILGTGSDVVGAGIKKTKGSIWTKVKSGAIALEQDVAKKSVKEGGFFKRLWKNIIHTPRDLVKGTKIGARAAKIAQKCSFLGGLKGLGKAIAKKMPFIGAILTIGFEIPNIITSFKEKGPLFALKETGRLAGGAAGAAIGSAICPGIGSIVGWIVGEWIAGKVVGESYSDQKEEAQAQADENGQKEQPAEQTQPTQQAQPTQPTQPAQPTQQAQPTQPAQPTQQTQPAEQETSTPETSTTTTNTTGITNPETYNPTQTVLPYTSYQNPSLYNPFGSYNQGSIFQNNGVNPYMTGMNNFNMYLNPYNPSYFNMPNNPFGMNQMGIQPDYSGKFRYLG